MKSLLFSVCVLFFASNSFAEQQTITIQVTDTQKVIMKQLMSDYQEVLTALPTTAFTKTTSYLFDSSKFGRAITQLSKTLMAAQESTDTELEFQQLLLMFSLEASKARQLTASELSWINDSLIEELKEQNTGFAEGILEGTSAMVVGAVVGVVVGITIVDQGQKRGYLFRANQDEVPALFLGIIGGAILGKTAQDMLDILQDDPFRIRIAPHQMTTDELLSQPTP